MIALEITFLAGRFHGNSWYHAHNEGVPEWPPSPWRILRALVSACYAEDIAPAVAEPLIAKLSVLPSYRLPLAVDAHVRHYMPDTDDANHGKSKVFDAFVAVEGGAADPAPITVAWPVELTGDERALLARLSRRVAYLGRAESWTDVRVVDVEGEVWNCWPDNGSAAASVTTLMTLSPPGDLSVDTAGQAASKKGQGPRTLWEVLTFAGSRFRDEGWSSVPGTRPVRYSFDRQPFRRAVVPRRARQAAITPTVARYAIRSAVLPRLREAVAIGERLRVAVMSRSKGVSGNAKPVFSGHGPTASDHKHAFYLACAEDFTNWESGFIDHLVVAASGGFDAEDIQALQQVRRIWARGGHDLELILTGLGTSSDFGGLQSPRSSMLAESRLWESVTPFVPSRHPKLVRGVQTDTIEQQIIRACEQLLGVKPVEVSPFGVASHWLAFRRRRLEGGGSHGLDTAVGVRLVFAEPVRGPIALGYGAHFGLGLFAAVCS